MFDEGSRRYSDLYNGRKLAAKNPPLVYTSVSEPTFNRVSLNETPDFTFWGLNIKVDFNLRDSKKWKYEETKWYNISYFYKTALPHS